MEIVFIMLVMAGLFFFHFLPNHKRYKTKEKIYYIFSIVTSSIVLSLDSLDIWMVTVSNWLSKYF